MAHLLKLVLYWIPHPSRQAAKIHGVAGLSHDSHAQLFMLLSLPYRNPPRK